MQTSVNEKVTNAKGNHQHWQYYTQSKKNRGKVVWYNSNTNLVQKPFIVCLIYANQSFLYHYSSGGLLI
jgi:hypothetical protein